MNPAIEALFIGPTLLAAFLIFANFNKANIKSNRWFGFFILLVFIIQLGVLFYDARLFGTESYIYDLISLANYIVAPVFYFSILYYAEPDRKRRFKDSLHFLFGLIMLVLTLLSFIVPAEKIKAEEQKELESKAELIFSIIFCLQVLPYCFAAYRKINSYQKNLLLYSSSTEKINLNWLKKIVICVFFTAVLWLSDGVFRFSEASVLFDAASSVLYFLCICYITYHALKQKELFPYNLKEKLEIETVIKDVQTDAEAKRKLISDEKLEEHVQALKTLMNTEKPHLNDEISLIRLAEQCKTSPHLLSYIINTGFGENFFQFVNRYRVEEAKKMILNPEMNYLSLMGIAFEAGFSSKAVFNATFKKVTGKTPSEFRKDPAD